MQLTQIILTVVWLVASCGAALMYTSISRTMLRRKALMRGTPAERIGHDYAVWAVVGAIISYVFFVATLVAILLPNSAISTTTGLMAITLPPLVQLGHSAYLLKRVNDLDG